MTINPACKEDYRDDEPYSVLPPVTNKGNAIELAETQVKLAF